MLDTFSIKIKANYVVAVTATTVVETGDENVATEVLRGLYTFASFKAARRFTTVINDAANALGDDKVAHLFKQKEPNDD